MIFNLDSSVSNDDLFQIFGVHGEIKEVRICLFPLVFFFQLSEHPMLFYTQVYLIRPVFLCFVFQIRETPNKWHHKFMEFYDVRAAEAALQSLNKCELGGKRIKLEPSRPGGARRKYAYD